MRIDIFSDVTCPWCLIGKRRLERALDQRPDIRPAVRWLPFQLNPDMPREGVERAAYLTLKFGGEKRARRFYAAIEDAGRDEGVPFRFERIARTPNTLDAHRLIRFGRAAERQDEVVEALFSSYFLEGADVGCRDVLVEVAKACGLDGPSTRRYLESDQDIVEVQAEDLRARRMGIDGVPWFVMNGRYALAGAQEAEAFLPLLDLATLEAA